jgi:hypothetical protein
MAIVLDCRRPLPESSRPFRQIPGARMYAALLLIVPLALTFDSTGAALLLGAPIKVSSA